MSNNDYICRSLAKIGLNIFVSVILLLQGGGFCEELSFHAAFFIVSLVKGGTRKRNE